MLSKFYSTCSADQTWTGEETDCVAVKCEAINSPANGNMICSKKRDFGSVCTINCDSGFDLVGPRQRACGAEGRWSGLPPTCQLIHCGPLTGMKILFLVFLMQKKVVTDNFNFETLIFEFY